MKVLITGAHGQVGTELRHQIAADYPQWQCLATDAGELDITRQQAVQECMAQEQPGMVINAAAYTAVDKAETEPALAAAVNADAPGYLAQACATAGIPLLHISTDYVFDGSATTPYKETDTVAPLGVYGETKEAGERAVRVACEQHIILRTAWVVSPHGNNFVKTMLRLGMERETLSVVADQWGGPTLAADIAATLLRLAASWQEHGDLAWGTYHYCGAPITSWHGFAEAIMAEARTQGWPLRIQHIDAIDSAAYPTPAQRPAFSALDGSRLAACFGIAACDWQSGLKSLIQQITLPE